MGKIGVDKVFEPGPGRIFVFGSNTVGRHGAGAAKTAWQRYGATMGQGRGLSGNSYAIPTKDHNLMTLELKEIKVYVDEFLRFAAEPTKSWTHHGLELTYFVTRIGCGLAGLKDEEVAPLFRGAPENVELPYGWRELAEG